MELYEDRLVAYTTPEKSTLFLMIEIIFVFFFFTIEQLFGIIGLKNGNNKNK